MIFVCWLNVFLLYVLIYTNIFRHSASMPLRNDCKQHTKSLQQLVEFNVIDHVANSDATQCTLSSGSYCRLNNSWHEHTSSSSLVDLAHMLSKNMWNGLRKRVTNRTLNGGPTRVVLVARGNREKTNMCKNNRNVLHLHKKNEMWYWNFEGIVLPVHIVFILFQCNSICHLLILIWNYVNLIYNVLNTMQDYMSIVKPPIA